jgi:thioredoxin reductase (NADPH)
VSATALFVMIGADPCTEASTGMLAVDAAGYLLCGTGAANCDGYLRWPLPDREPHLLETVRPGVFAAGDVRSGASNRVAGAVGDGAMVVRFAHEVLAG